MALMNNNNQTSNTIPEIETDEVTFDNVKVILLHDSLCGKINDTILSRENITMKKIWAPNLNEINKTLDEMDNTDTIVIQALTNDLRDKTINDMEEIIKETISKASTKAKHVVISTIVGREDDDSLKAKAEVINANIKYTYLKDPTVLVCDNGNLKDVKFRLSDGVHLSDHGTAVLASNLKYKIAEALNVKVLKKDRYKRTDKSYQRRYGGFNNGGYNNGGFSSGGYNNRSYNNGDF